MIESILKEAYNQITHSQLTIHTKSDDKDLVTNMDVQVEQFITSKLLELYPEAKIYGEESHHSIDLNQGEVWIIDPIDGTVNFVKQNYNFCILCAYMIDGHLLQAYLVDGNQGDIYKIIKGKGLFKNNEKMILPKDMNLSNSLIYCNPMFAFNDPKIKSIFDKSFGTRYLASCGMDAIQVINNRSGCCLTLIAEVWDVACSIMIAQETNLKCVNFDGTTRLVHQRGPYIFGYPTCVDEVVQILNGK